MSEESKKDRIVKFVKKNKLAIQDAAVYTTIALSAYAVTYVIIKIALDCGEAQADLSDARVKYNTLYEAVAAGHNFRYEPETNNLWDITLRTDKA